MHYYQFNIADWNLGTAHLSLEEEAAYFRLVNYYYDTESPIPLETQSVFRKLRMIDKADVGAAILEEFFTKTDSGWIHSRCEEGIKKYKKTKKKNAKNGRAGGRPRKDAASKETQQKPTGFPEGTEEGASGNPNQEPLTKNQEPETNTKNTPSESAKADPDVPDEKPKPRRFKFETHHHELAVRMSNPVKCRFPHQDINLDQWADAVRKLQELDKRPREEIIRLWHWIVNHERGNFSWAENCRSPMKLREKKDGLPYYEIIRTQMLRESAGHSSRPNMQSLEEQLTDRSWAADLQTIEGQS